MKRLVIVAIMAAFLLGTVGAAQAAKLNVTGDFQQSFNYVKNPTFDSDENVDKFQAVQRFRATFEFVANENLKAVVRVHTGDYRWGSELAEGQGVGANATPGGFDTDNRRNFDYDRAYLDFMIPNTEVNIKSGLLPLTLPNSLGSHILDGNVWALLGSAPINDMVALTLGWGRLNDQSSQPLGLDPNSSSKDEVDMFFAILPVTMDGFQVTPFGVYARSGKNAFGNWADGVLLGELGVAAYDATLLSPQSANHYWFGVNATVDMFDPIVVMADFNYGGRGDVVKYDGTSLGKAAGWIANLAVAYNMDMMTPTLWGLYESGESRSSADLDNKGKVMPTVAPDTFGISTFGFSGSNFRGYAGGILGLNGPTGKWGVGVKLADISFLDKLTHDFQVAYYKGTNHKDNLDLFTTKDKAWEVNFDSQYQVYENLAAIVELGYINMNLQSDSTMLTDDDAAWKAAAGFRYRF